MALDLTTGPITSSGFSTVANRSVGPYTAPPAGSLILAVIYFAGATAVSLTGYTTIVSPTSLGASAVGRMHIYYKIAAGSETTTVFTHASAQNEAHVLVVRGNIDSGSPFDATLDQNVNAVAAESTVNVGPVTTANANAALVGFACTDATADFTWTGLAERTDGARQSVASDIQAAAGVSGTITAAMTISDGWNGTLIAVKDNAGGVVFTPRLGLLGVGD